ncbi:MAG TPA: 50S ribosomal protein L3 [Limnochordia bacterium]|nr:50S ribosomal protein L3 [Limnochordia bacterium]
MPKGLLGTKIGMTQIFDADGRAVAVTVIDVSDCRVVQKKDVESDGYEAVQLGLGERKVRRAPKALQGHAEKHNTKTPRYLREVRAEGVDAYADLAPGDAVAASLFADGEYVDVTGVTKGKGFAGGVKRHNFNRGPMGHGSMYHRRVGSLGATDPQRVFKGRRMPGQLGHAQRTIQGLKLVRVDAERGLLLIKGAVPGPKGSLVSVSASVKHKA